MLAPNDDVLPLMLRPRTTIDPDGTVEGYASLFGEIDQARDMVMPGAFRQTLMLRGVRRVPMLFQHDPAEPVGVWHELREDHRGLLARGRLIPEVARARELLALLRVGAVDGLSIGFKTVKGRLDPKSRIRRLDQVELWEISIVTFPLLAGARVRAVKDNPLASQRLSSPLPDSSPHSPSKTGVNALWLGEERARVARARAERQWQSVWHAASAGADEVASDGAPMPPSKRLAALHARRHGPPRRDRIRGWIAQPPADGAADLQRLFAPPR